MQELNFHLDRSVLIEAEPETVFRFFTDSARWARWWGAGSTIEARPGGKVYIRHGNGIESGGEVLEIKAPERIVFSYGFASGVPMALGASRVTITLLPEGEATRLCLQHDFDSAGPRDQHVQGWRFQLSLFANAVADEVHAGAAEAVDGWFAAWAIHDVGARGQALGGLVSDDIEFRDRYSLLAGVADLSAHIAASQHFMPGITLRREGGVRHCQGTVLADWTAHGAGDAIVMRGTNVFRMDAKGRIRGVVGLAGQTD